MTNPSQSQRYFHQFRYTFPTDKATVEIARNTGEQPMLVSVEELLGEGQAKSGAHGVPFSYSFFDDTRLRELTFYVHDHLGNTRVTYTVGCDGSNGAGHLRTLEHAVDYFPYGSILREFVNSTGPEKYLTTHHERDVETGLDYRGARYYDSDVARFLSLDPAQAEYPSLSPYSYVAGNPISLIDPDGRRVDDFVFNECGNFVRVDKNNCPDRLVIENQSTCSQNSYEFSDPIEDPAQIRDGIINKVVIVDESRIQCMLEQAGAFSSSNRDSEWSYMRKESPGTKKLDFSYSAIPGEFAVEGASANPLATPSPMLFIPEGGSHAENHMNFGNFLWGAAGHSLGFSGFALKNAAHYNSLFNSETNGYPSQWDTDDDQGSIGRGVQHSKDKGYRGIVK